MDTYTLQDLKIAACTEVFKLGVGNGIAGLNEVVVSVLSSRERGQCGDEENSERRGELHFYWFDLGFLGSWRV
jgi:hypothetical protein